MRLALRRRNISLYLIQGLHESLINFIPPTPAWEIERLKFLLIFFSLKKII